MENRLDKFKLPEELDIELSPYLEGNCALENTLIYFTSFNDLQEFIESFFSSFKVEIQNIFSFKLKTQLKFIRESNKRIYFDIKDDTIYIDHEHPLISFKTNIDLFQMVRLIGHELLGHAFHNLLAKRTKRPAMSDKTIFSSENIAQYCELLAFKIISEVWKPPYIKINYHQWESKLLYQFAYNYKHVFSSRSIPSIDPVLHLPLLPLKYKAYLEPKFLLHCLYYGYVPYEILENRIEDYCHQNNLNLRRVI